MNSHNVDTQTRFSPWKLLIHTVQMKRPAGSGPVFGGGTFFGVPVESFLSWSPVQ